MIRAEAGSDGEVNITGISALGFGGQFTGSKTELDITISSSVAVALFRALGSELVGRGHFSVGLFDPKGNQVF